MFYSSRNSFVCYSKLSLVSFPLGIHEVLDHFGILIKYPLRGLRIDASLECISLLQRK